MCWRLKGFRQKQTQETDLKNNNKNITTTITISLVLVEQVRMFRKMNNIMKNDFYPLNALEVFQHSSFSGRLIPPRCKAERYREFFLLATTKLFNVQ